MFFGGLGSFKDDDVSVVLTRRAADGVGLDPQSSLRALIAEGRRQFRNTPAAQLTLLYAWLGRIESNFDDAGVFDGVSKFGTTTSTEFPCGPLCARMSSDRRRALAMCGWSDLCSPVVDAAAANARSLDTILSATPVQLVRNCLLDGDVERAAAIALLHGLVEVSVQILTIAAAGARLATATGSGGQLEAELLQLTAMALAGW